MADDGARVGVAVFQTRRSALPQVHRPLLPWHLCLALPGHQATRYQLQLEREKHPPTPQADTRQTSPEADPSAWGYVTGDQETQNKGNIQAEEAQWKYKQATDGGIPVPSAEGVKGKLESVAGMVTGDQNKQMEGNARAEKAAWKDGV